MSSRSGEVGAIAPAQTCSDVYRSSSSITMTQYFVKHLLTTIPTLIAISLVIFTILVLAPGDPTAAFALNPSLTEEVQENIRRSLGLDQPLPVRYVKWAWAFLQGDTGYSFTSRSPVSELIAQRLPTTP